MPQADAEAMKSIVLKLKSVLEREPTLWGDELEQAIKEKESLVEALREGLHLGEAGDFERVHALESLMKPLALANLGAFKFNQIRLQLSKIGSPKPSTATARRVDLTF
jgi:hypothetical protein